MPPGYGANSLNFYLGGDCKSRNAMVVYANSFNLQVVFCHPIPCILNPWELTSGRALRMNMKRLFGGQSYVANSDAVRTEDGLSGM